METRNSYSPSHIDELLPSEAEVPILTPTQHILQAQLLGAEEVRILRETPRFDAQGAAIPSPYFNFEDTLDFSEAAIQASAFRLAAETLPREVVDRIGINHNIPDNVGYQHPPSLDTIGLTLEAWTSTGFDPDLKIAIEAMCTYSNNSMIIDAIQEAMENAEMTQESITSHRLMVASKETPEEQRANQLEAEALARIPLHDPYNYDYDPYYESLPLQPSQNAETRYAPTTDEYHERLVTSHMVAYAMKESVKAAHLAREYQRHRGASSPAHTQPESLSQDARTVKVDMNQFLYD